VLEYRMFWRLLPISAPKFKEENTATTAAISAIGDVGSLSLINQMGLYFSLKPALITWP
jgi:hypothetical protein